MRKAWLHSYKRKLGVPAMTRTLELRTPAQAQAQAQSPPAQTASPPSPPLETLPLPQSPPPPPPTTTMPKPPINRFDNVVSPAGVAQEPSMVVSPSTVAAIAEMAALEAVKQVTPVIARTADSVVERVNIHTTAEVGTAADRINEHTTSNFKLGLEALAQQGATLQANSLQTTLAALGKIGDVVAPIGRDSARAAAAAEANSRALQPITRDAARAAVASEAMQPVTADAADAANRAAAAAEGTHALVDATRTEVIATVRDESTKVRELIGMSLENLERLVKSTIASCVEEAPVELTAEASTPAPSKRTTRSAASSAAGMSGNSCELASTARAHLQSLAPNPHVRALIDALFLDEGLSLASCHSNAKRLQAPLIFLLTHKTGAEVMGACFFITALTRSVGDPLYRLAGKLTHPLVDVILCPNPAINVRVLAAETLVEMAAHSPAREMLTVRSMRSRPEPPPLRPSESCPSSGPLTFAPSIAPLHRSSQTPVEPDNLKLLSGAPTPILVAMATTIVHVLEQTAVVFKSLPPKKLKVELLGLKPLLRILVKVKDSSVTTVTNDAFKALVDASPVAALEVLEALGKTTKATSVSTMLMELVKTAAGPTNNSDEDGDVTTCVMDELKHELKKADLNAPAVWQSEITSLLKSVLEGVDELISRPVATSRPAAPPPPPPPPQQQQQQQRAAAQAPPPQRAAAPTPAVEPDSSATPMAKLMFELKAKLAARAQAPEACAGALERATARDEANETNAEMRLAFEMRMGDRRILIEPSDDDGTDWEEE